MNRRGFLGSILALGMAPAIVKAANLMPVFARSESGLILPTQWTHGKNGLLTIEMITREALKILENNLTMESEINKEWDMPSMPIGQIITVRQSVRFAA